MQFSPFEISCSPMLRVLAAISSSGARWSISFNLPSTAIFSGPSNSTWGANSTDSASFSLSRLSTQMAFPLSLLGIYTTMDAIEGSHCVSGVYCCTGSDGIPRTFDLIEVTGAKKYQVYMVSAPVFEWDLFINVTIGNTSSKVSLLNTATEATWPENSLSPVLNARVIPFDSVSSILGSHFSESMIAVDSTWSRLPFYIPDSALPPTKASFFNSLTQLGICDLQSAKVIANQPGITDRFEIYSTLSSTVNTRWADSLVSLSQSRLYPNSGPHRLVVSLNGRSTTLVEVLLQSENYTLSILTAEPVGTGGYGYMNTETSTFHAFVDVTNAGRLPGYVQVTSDRCCYAPSNASNPTLSCAYLFNTVTGSAHVQGQFMSSAETLRFRFQTQMDLSGQSGYCTFILSDGGPTYRRTYDVGFPMETSTISPSTPTSQCEPPFIVLTEPPFCQSPCTADQTYNTTTSSCDPVDCVIKYKGGRPYYDPETGVCKPYTVPSTAPSSSPPGEEEPMSPPVEVIPAVTVPTNGTPAFPMAPDGTYSINCGEHGTYDAQSMTCNCDAGWITDMNQPVYDFEFCGLQSLFEPGQIYDSQSPGTKGKVNYFTLIVAVTITFVGVIIVALIAAYILSNRNSNGENDDDQDSSEESSETA